MGTGHFWWGIGGILPFLSAIAIIVVIIAVLRFIFFRRSHIPPWMSSCHTRAQDIEGPENAIDILKKRYAKGEINREEYEQIKKDITD